MAQARGVEFVSNDKGLDVLAETMRQAVKKTSPDKVQISFCGPKGLLLNVREIMRALNIPQTNLHIELFEFR